MRRDPTLASTLASFPWVLDNITADEGRALAGIASLASNNISLGRAVLGFPWVLDGATEVEGKALGDIAYLASKDLSLGTNVAGFRWVLDGVTRVEAEAIAILANLAGTDVYLATTVAGFPWIRDGISEGERKALGTLASSLAYLAVKDPALAKKAVAYPWMADNITNEESLALANLSYLVSRNSALGRQVAAMPFLSSSLEAHDRYALNYLGDLNAHHPDKLALLVEQPWFLDGLSDQEASLVTVLGYQARLSTEDFKSLVRTHSLESRTINMALSEKAALTVFASSARELNTDTVKHVEEAVKVLERFMDVPFPEREVIVLFASPGRSTLYSISGEELLGRFVGTHIIVNPRQATGGDTSDANRVITHELAHYYWREHRGHLRGVWLLEGGPDFLASYVFQELYGARLQDRIKYLQSSPVHLRDCEVKGMTSIQKLIDQRKREGAKVHAETPYFICNYILGEYFLLNLYETIGPNGFRAAWKEIYLLAKSQQDPVGEDKVYATFRRHVPADKVNAFKDLYKRWHGGTFAD